jgi:hypothetical protein
MEISGLGWSVNQIATTRPKSDRRFSCASDLLSVTHCHAEFHNLARPTAAEIKLEPAAAEMDMNVTSGPHPAGVLYGETSRHQRPVMQSDALFKSTRQ